MRIGVDFDNTIINYDDVFLSMARDRGLIDACSGGSKQAIRDAIRLLPDGEVAWQKLQGQVYGKGIAGAKMIDGVGPFLRRCRTQGISVVIVSHKTEFGHYDPDRVNLRQAALGWMKAQGLFAQDYGLDIAGVYFETTRAEKLQRIAALGLSHFVDDLEEVLTDPEFPAGVQRLLLTENAPVVADASLIVCSDWRQIEERIFHARA